MANPLDMQYASASATWTNWPKRALINDWPASCGQILLAAGKPPFIRLTVSPKTAPVCGRAGDDVIWSITSSNVASPRNGMQTLVKPLFRILVDRVNRNHVGMVSIPSRRALRRPPRDET